MNSYEKKSAMQLLLRIAALLDVTEEVADTLLQEVRAMNQEKPSKAGAILGDLIKLIQLLEKHYNLLRVVEKEQITEEELPKPDEQMIRNYLNDKYQNRSKAEKTLLKHKTHRN
jgi:hypothetical protein